MPFESYRNLDVWKKAHELVIKSYKITEKFPKEEKYRIMDQILRASVSVPTNIAEGMSRNTSKDKIHFLIISRASLTETGYLFELSKDLKYIELSEYNEIETEINEIGKKLNALITHFRSNLNN